MSKRTFNIISGSAALIFGGILYILFRQDTSISMYFKRVAWIKSLIDPASQMDCILLKYYLQDFLWALSLGCFLNAVIDSNRRIDCAGGIIALLCGCFWEIMQSVKIARGTGDILDIAMYFVAGVVCSLINIKEREE